MKCCTDDQKNALMLICGNCKCKVMKPGTGTLTEKEVIRGWVGLSQLFRLTRMFYYSMLLF